MKKYLLFISLFFMAAANAQFFKKNAGLANSFTIVARDEVTGKMAVGVQSHWFSVGTPLFRYVPTEHLELRINPLSAMLRNKLSKGF